MPESFRGFDPLDFLVTFAALLFVLVSHEMAHGYVALWNGDDTARRAGRLTWNPLQHLDPIGLLCMVVLHFGWAKPVPVDPSLFRNRRMGLITVSLAGVTVNMLTAMLSLFLIRHIPALPDILLQFLWMVALYGVSFAIFNLIPFPPLDGSRIVTAFLPVSLQRKLAHFERYAFFVLLVLMWLGVIGKVISPVIDGLLRWMVRTV